VLLTATVDGGVCVCLLHPPVALPMGKEAPVIIGLGGWVVPKAGLGVLEREKVSRLSGIENYSYSVVYAVASVDNIQEMSAILTNIFRQLSFNSQ